MKRAIVTGVQGQDGSYLVENLLNADYSVVGVGRRRLDDFSKRDQRLTSLSLGGAFGEKFKYRICDLRDSTAIHALVAEWQPDIIFNLAAMSSPAESWDNPVGTISNDTHAVVNILDSIRFLSKDTKLVQACTASIFHSSEKPIHEGSPIKIVTPYAAAKYAAHSICEQYRDRYGLNVSNAIMFNHESIWRPESFVTRKITKAVAQIRANPEMRLKLWTLLPVRDWGWASEFMEAFRLIGEKEEPVDLILATGQGVSLAEFTSHVFGLANLDADEYVDVAPQGRNTGVDISVGNPSLASEKLGWKANILWKEVASRMLDNDIRLLAETML